MAHPGVYIITAAVGVLAGLFLYFSTTQEGRQRERPSDSHNRRYRYGNKTDNFVDNNNKCMICLDTISNDFEREYLRCGHTFHNKCIMTWNRINDICPLCKEKTGLDI